MKKITNRIVSSEAYKENGEWVYAYTFDGCPFGMGVTAEELTIYTNNPDGIITKYASIETEMEMSVGRIKFGAMNIIYPGDPIRIVVHHGGKPKRGTIKVKTAERSKTIEAIVPGDFPNPNILQRIKWWWTYWVYTKSIPLHAR